MEPLSITETHTCACSETHDALPELDTRVLPRAIRHGAIFGALSVLPPGAGLLLTASHDPLPLLAQLEERTPGAFEVTYVQRGPAEWKLRFVRS